MRKAETRAAELGELIKELRLKAGLTQEQLADDIGVSRATLNYIEGGHNPSGVETLRKIADRLRHNLVLRAQS
jgi:transcriptional regulator with XRE-family HTH domain